MNNRIIERIRTLQNELESELSRRREELHFSVRNHKVTFERGVIHRHRRFKKRLRRYLAEANPLSILTAPLIYALIVPFVLLDLFVSLYHAVCFPVYGIPKVRRRDYIVIDRHKLAYLNAFEKLNCVYCGYGNGLIGWVREIAARTEQYWCPIKHAERVADPHSRYGHYLDYGDAEAYRKELEEVCRRFDDTTPGGREE